MDSCGDYPSHSLSPEDQAPDVAGSSHSLGGGGARLPRGRLFRGNYPMHITDYPR